ncbi:MAG: hypothetical protein K9J81_00305 [Desulfohalobiaceae bacterium]|nr:hypothetical protein [Desulfohalobiaceae bacterium]
MKKTIFSRSLCSVFVCIIFSTFLHAQDIEIHDGWNLKGATETIDVYNAFNDTAIIESVWKWKNKNWELYLPKDENGSYAVSKGFGKLNTINDSEGYWVNANANVTIENNVGPDTFDFKDYICLQGQKIYKIVYNDGDEYFIYDTWTKDLDNDDVYIQNWKMVELNGKETFNGNYYLRVDDNGSVYETHNDYFTYNPQKLHGTSNMLIGDTIINTYEGTPTELNQSYQFDLHFSEYTFLGFCDVQTPAGTFHNCLKKLETREGGEVRLYFLAPGLGPIKRHRYLSDSKYELIYANVNGTEYGTQPTFQ